jgi:uncharacterized membrane protein
LTWGGFFFLSDHHRQKSVVELSCVVYLGNIMTMHNTEHLHRDGESHHGHGQTPYWRRAHHDWRFWFGLVAMIVAIAVYVGTNDLSMVPSGRQKHMPAGSRVP